jgi:hypothetical protein
VRSSGRSGAIGAVGAVAARPGLWPVALRQLLRLAGPGWWRRPPFLPVPPTDYRRFRLQTQYGDPRHPVEAADVVRYLDWCRRWRSAT